MPYNHTQIRLNFPLSADQLAMGVGMGVGVPLSKSHLQAQVQRRRLRDGTTQNARAPSWSMGSAKKNILKTKKTAQKPWGKANK